VQASEARTRMFIKYCLSYPLSHPLFFFSLSLSLSRSDRVRRHTSSRRWYHPRRALTAADALLLREPSAVAISADSNKTAVTKSVPPYICHYVSLSTILFFFFLGVSNTKLYFYNNIVTIV